MKESKEPSKRIGKRSAKRRTRSGSKGVYVEQLRFQHLYGHFALLLGDAYIKPFFYRFQAKLENAKALQIANYRNKADRLVSGFLHKLTYFKPNFAALAVFLLLLSVFTHYAIATAASTTPLNNFLLQEETEENTEEEKELVYEPISTSHVVNSSAFKLSNVPPREPQTVVIDTVSLPVTAYSSTPDQTDGNPFITASGSTVRDGIVAANFVPIGTQIRIPEYYGDKVFVVEDRMNSRYWKKVDIWMPTRAEAIHFGLRNTYIEIVEVN